VLRLAAWLFQLGQQPALRALICDELLQPLEPAVAAAAASLAATAQLPAEAAAVARMLQQQREQLLGKVFEALPTVGPTVPRESSRYMPALPEGQPRSNLYWVLSILTALPDKLVEVRQNPLLSLKLSNQMTTVSSYLSPCAGAQQIPFRLQSF
jgi:hypothetical protein